MFVSVCLFWGLFGLLTEDIRLFAFHLFSYKLRIVDRLQNVDDRQSLERARHGLKKKALTTILLGGTPAVCHNRLLWIQAVKDHFDDVPLFVSNCKQLQLVFEAATHVGYDVYQVDAG